MFISWLNFEDLLVHKPVDLINFSKDKIDVTLSKEQYIDFFSNKAVYMGLYYSEEMDFCVMFYADPLQSEKQGEMYAQGQIDVSMKIYRMKVLSNVYILKGNAETKKWGITKTGMRVSPHVKQITMVQAGALTRCEITNNITGWTDGTKELNYGENDFIIDGYGMRGLHNG